MSPMFELESMLSLADDSFVTRLNKYITNLIKDMDNYQVVGTIRTQGESIKDRPVPVL
jgi:hypothetical protein